MKLGDLKLLIFTFLLLPAFAFAAKDTSDYTLRVEILSYSAHSYNPVVRSEYDDQRYMVDGRGNITDGTTKHAFDFQYDGELYSPNMLKHRIFDRQTYLAKWKKPQRELELLMPIGKKGRHETRDLQTYLLEGVYVTTRQGLIAISQDAYQAQQAQNEGTQGRKQSANLADLSVTSDPDNAEIGVDGELVGTTPSVLQLRVGEHTITLKKTGYKPWQRKMVLVTGRIELKGKPEPESPQ
jgi:diacylglycerol kinase family enzyme